MRHWLKLPDRCLHEHVGSYARGGSVQFNSSRDVVTHRTPRLLVVCFAFTGVRSFLCHSEEEDNCASPWRCAADARAVLSRVRYTIKANVVTMDLTSKQERSD